MNCPGLHRSSPVWIGVERDCPESFTKKWSCAVKVRRVWFRTATENTLYVRPGTGGVDWTRTCWKGGTRWTVLPADVWVIRESVKRAGCDRGPAGGLDVSGGWRVNDARASPRPAMRAWAASAPAPRSCFVSRGSNSGRNRVVDRGRMGQAVRLEESGVPRSLSVEDSPGWRQYPGESVVGGQ